MDTTLLQKLVRLLSSLRLAAFNLLSLFVIVFFGTLMQSRYGIVYVQDNIFRSWFVWLSLNGGFQLPIFFGGASISLLLFVNLMFSGVLTRPLRFNKLGISLTHAGVAFFVLSEVITAHFSKETQLQLTVGERSSYSVDPKEMQLVSVEFDHARDTEICCQAVDFSDLEVGKRFQISDQGHTLCVVDFTRRGNVITKHKNTYLTDVSVQKERDENNNRLPLHHVVLFDLYSPANKRMKRMVVEQKKGADLPFFNTHNTSVMFNIVHKREQLEHQFYLNSFTHEVYPKTTIPKHFESELTIYDNDGTFDRKASISMNKPLYLGNKTYYQSGFTSLENKEVSILHVVENPGKSIPYIAAIIVVFGMAFQFLVQLYRYSRRHI